MLPRAFRGCGFGCDLNSFIFGVRYMPEEDVDYCYDGDVPEHLENSSIFLVYLGPFYLELVFGRRET